MSPETMKPHAVQGAGLQNVRHGGEEHPTTRGGERQDSRNGPGAQGGSIYREAMRPKARRGSKSTSVAAAIDATPKAPTMTDRIWAMLEHGPLSPEEAHAKLEAEDGGRVLLTSVRARMCGLHKSGRVVDSGERGLGESQRSKVVRWRRATAEEYSSWVAAHPVEGGEA